jgi:restriction endonuclease S subunit
VTLPVSTPPLGLQDRFAARLADLRAIIAQQKRALAAALDLERSLLAQLLG